MLLQLRSIARRYARRDVLAGIDLDLEPGRCLGLLGHNGAGKTTLLRIVLGLIRPSSGQVLVEGFDPARWPREARARMGGLIEVPGFLPQRSGLDNLAALARLAGRSRHEARREAGRLIELVGLAHAGERRVQGWSQGMRQRLGIAQALIGDPRLIVLDEPTNGLDPEGIAELRELVRSWVHEEGRGVILSSHQLAEVSGLVTDVAVLRQGKLVARGPTHDLLQASTDAYDVGLADPDRLHAWLAEQGVTPTATEGELVRVPLGECSPGHLARELTGIGELEHFAPERRSLEQIYLRADENQLVPLPAATRSKGEPDPLAPSTPLRRVFGYELTRHWANPRLWALWSLPTLLAIVAIGRRFLRSQGDTSAVGDQEVFSATQVTAFEAFGIGLQAGLPLLALVAVALASQSVAAELGRGTLRNLVLQPVGRVSLSLGKLSAALFTALLGYAVLAGATFLAARTWFEFGDVVEILPNGATFPLVEAAELWPLFERALLAPLLPLLALTAWGLAASAATRTAAGALGLSLGGLLAFDLARGVLRTWDVEGWLPTAHLPSPLGDSSFLQFYTLAVTGVSNATYELGNQAAFSSVGWLLAATVLTCLLVVRRSIP